MVPVVVVLAVLSVSVFVFVSVDAPFSSVVDALLGSSYRATEHRSDAAGDAAFLVMVRAFVAAGSTNGRA